MEGEQAGGFGYGGSEEQLVGSTNSQKPTQIPAPPPQHTTPPPPPKQVDAVFTGHEHAYARTCALRNGACDGARGTVHILAGNAGAGFTHNFPRRADGRGGYDLEPWVVAAAQDVNGYVRVAATAAEMRIEAVRSDDGAVFDAVTLRARSSGGGRGSVTKSGSGQGSTSSGSSTTAASSSSGRAGGSGGGGGASRWNGVWAPLAALWRGWSIS